MADFAGNDITAPKGPIYVICTYEGYEGHGAPRQAFTDLDDAKAAVKLANSSYGATYRLYAVPIWPKPVEEMKPIEIE